MLKNYLLYKWEKCRGILSSSFWKRQKVYKIQSIILEKKKKGKDRVSPVDEHKVEGLSSHQRNPIPYTLQNGDPGLRRQTEA